MFERGDVGFLLMFVVLPVTYVLLWALMRYMVNKFPKQIIK